MSCLAIDVAGSIRSGRVIKVLARLVSQHGAPRFPALGKQLTNKPEQGQSDVPTIALLSTDGGVS